MTSSATNTTRAESGAAASALGGAVAGLVPSKTSPSGILSVNLSKPECALRRIARLKRSVWLSGKLHGLADRGHRPPVCWFVTLTYRPGVEWSPLHMAKAVDRFRQFCKRAKVPCRYTWVGELQNRGAVHYHLLAWLPVGVRMPQWDRDTHGRQRFWPHGMTNTEPAKAGVGYLMKYLSKLGEFHTFPKGMRLYGIGGLDDSGKSIRSWSSLPEWVKAAHGVGEVCRWAGRLLVRATGELLEPAYRVSIVPGALILRQLRELPQRFHDGPYSRLTPYAA